MQVSVGIPHAAGVDAFRFPRNLCEHLLAPLAAEGLAMHGYRELVPRKLQGAGLKLFLGLFAGGQETRVVELAAVFLHVAGKVTKT